MEKLTSLPKEEVYRYLGYQKEMQPISEPIQDLIDSSIQKILNTAQPRFLTSNQIPLHREKGRIYADNLCLEGTDIAEHLKKCHSAVLLAVTLGTAVDTMIRQTEIMDMAKAVILDSAANVAIEQYADVVEADLRNTIEDAGQFLTMRFSPGYGDLPITTQKPLIERLEAAKKIGLTLTLGNLMIPKKSITAILGVADIPVQGKLAGCVHCVLKETCRYRKRGTTCAESK